MGVGDVFHKLWGGIEWVAVHVKEGFVKLFGEQAAKDFAKASLELLKSNAGQVVLTAVAGLMNVQGMSGADKKAAAFKEVVGGLEKQGVQLGKDIAESEINLLIETSVNALKGHFAPIMTAGASPAVADTSEIAAPAAVAAAADPGAPTTQA